MGSWTGKYDPLRAIHNKVKKTIGFDPSLASKIHVKLANKAHSMADTYLNQEPEGSENRRKLSKEDKRNRAYATQRDTLMGAGSGPDAQAARDRLGGKPKRLTIMGGRYRGAT